VIPTPDPYRPPAADPTAEPATAPVEGGPALRLAGAFLILRSLRVASLAPEQIERLLDRGSAVVAGTVVAALIPLIVDVLLAAPLLRGSARWRVPTWVRAASVPAYIVLQAGMFLALRSHPQLGAMAETLRDASRRGAIPAALFAAAVILLVHRGRRRWRLVAGLATMAAYWLWVLF
jgi:hypothetical protein